MAEQQVEQKGEEALSPASDTLIGGGGAPTPQEGVDGGAEGAETGSLISGGKGEGGGEDGEKAPAVGEEGVEKQLSEEEWIEKVSFTEEIGKDAEGKPVVVDKGFLKQFAPVLREVGLGPEQASKLVTVYAKLEKELYEKGEAARKAEEAEFKARRDAFRAESVKTLSQEDLDYANRAMDTLKKDDPTFYKTVQASVLGVHPSFLKLCAMAGRRVSDDTLPKPAGVGGGAQKTRGQILFADEIRAGNAR